MKSRIVQTVIILVSLGGCHDDKSKNKAGQTTVSPQVQTAPVVALGLNGGLAAGSIAWTLPDFLKEKFQDLNKANVEAAIGIDLTNGADRKTTHVNSGFTVKPCDPAVQTDAFVSGVAKSAADNVPSRLKLDVDEVSSWTAESKTFQGRLFLRKAYKAEGETGIYRIDALVTNTKLSECVLWNLVFTPNTSTSAKFIEESDEYKALMTSLSVTWEDLGADFDE